MNVIAKRNILKAGEKFGLVAEMNRWYRDAKSANWQSMGDVRIAYASTDKVGRVLIFNIRGNQFRLITQVNFAIQTIFFKALMTHKEYDRGEWKKWT